MRPITLHHATSKTVVIGGGDGYLIFIKMSICRVAIANDQAWMSDNKPCANWRAIVHSKADHRSHEVINGLYPFPQSSLWSCLHRADMKTAPGPLDPEVIRQPSKELLKAAFGSGHSAHQTVCRQEAWACGRMGVLDCTSSSQR